jgi:predicted nucleotidyltransferase
MAFIVLLAKAQRGKMAACMKQVGHSLSAERNFSPFCRGFEGFLFKPGRLYNIIMTIPFEDIQAMAGQIADQFKPSRIYLFGSYAYGHPTAESDIDLLVVMNAPDTTKPAFYAASKIRRALPRHIPIDVLVREPADFEARVKGFDGFLSTIADEGVLLYSNEAQTA